MESSTSDKEGIRILVEVLLKKGVKRVVLSPGSRNAPLIIAFARERQMEHFVVVDERSAAFFALGMVQQSGQPVALVCTSGTAPLNYAPAIAEAYYQRLPLIVISADRPVEWIDQDDCQTIRQVEIFRNIVKASYQLVAELREDDERWYVNRLVNDAVNEALKGRRGPVHLNVPLREPLYGVQACPARGERIVEYIDAAKGLDSEVAKELADRFCGSQKVMILAGFHLPDRKLKEALHQIAAFRNVVVLSETVTNLGSDRHIGTIDRVLAAIADEEREQFVPDLLITFGGALISKHVKVFLRKGQPRQHWCLDRSEHPADTLKVMTRQINLEAGDFFPQFSPYIHDIESDYARRWREKKELATQRHEAFERTVEWSDWKAFSLLLPALPQGSALQVSNSTPVRYAQLFEYPQVARVDGNRGTSGIDGSTSTAIGASRLNPGITTLITGDMSFLYDSNGLWNKYLTPRLKIIVMKNGGGGIFRFIEGPSRLEELEEYFETRQEVNVRGFAGLYHFDYFRAAGIAELESILPEFFKMTDTVSILEVETPGLLNADILRNYFKSLKGNSGID